MGHSIWPFVHGRLSRPGIVRPRDYAGFWGAGGRPPADLGRDWLRSSADGRCHAAYRRPGRIGLIPNAIRAVFFWPTHRAARAAAAAFRQRGLEWRRSAVGSAGLVAGCGGWTDRPKL